MDAATGIGIASLTLATTALVRPSVASFWRHAVRRPLLDLVDAHPSADISAGPLGITIRLRWTVRSVRSAVIISGIRVDMIPSTGEPSPRTFDWRYAQPTSSAMALEPTAPFAVALDEPKTSDVMFADTPKVVAEIDERMARYRKLWLAAQGGFERAALQQHALDPLSEAFRAFRTQPHAKQLEEALSRLLELPAAIYRLQVYIACAPPAKELVLRGKLEVSKSDSEALHRNLSVLLREACAVPSGIYDVVSLPCVLERPQK